MATDYSVEEVAALLRLPEAEVRRCWKEGVLSTPWSPGTRARLSFQDLVLLRSVASLAERVPPHRVRRALRMLRERLPGEVPLSSIQMSAGGKDIVVKEGGRAWNVESRQILLDLSEASAGHRDAIEAPVPLPASRAEQAYLRGCDLDASDTPAAMEAYRQALALDAGHVEARINLGRLLHASGDLKAAETEFRRAVDLRPDDATLVFNLAVTLEDSGQVESAMQSYARAVFLDPRFADAHFNLARLYEQRGDRLAALRHLSAYRATQERMS